MKSKFKILYSFLFLAVCVNTVQSQTLREKIGQMVMVGFYQYTNFMDTLLIDISQRNLGGVILFGSNITSPTQIQTLTSQLQQSATIPLFIATDQEGGFVARFKASNGFQSTYTAYTLGTIFNSEDSTRATAELMAQWLYDSGVNINLAPVVDVNVNPLSPAIGYYERSYSSDPMIVFNHANWFIDEFNQKNILTSLKHYPGHGSAVGDSHLGFTDITTTWADSELIPYRQLINQGYSNLIMTGHLYNANLDSIYPASLSYKTVTDLLKDSLGFTGAVISDEMMMGAISNNYGFKQAIELAINAGTDILLYRSNERNNGSLVKQFINTVEQKVDSGFISESRIEEAYCNILDLKQQLLTIDRFIVKDQLPNTINLHNYPNPFNATTTIMFSVPKRDDVIIKIYNTIGQEIETIVCSNHEAGNYKYYWDAIKYASGLYYCTFKSGKYYKIRKLILLK